jgi:serine/threonine protein phosphatase PrpC
MTMHSETPMSTDPHPRHSSPSPSSGSITDRVRGFFGWPRETSAADPDDVPAEQATDPAAQEQPARGPKTLGQPIYEAGADDQLGSSLWTTQARVSADGGTLGPLTVRAASVCGRRHARRGETREDAFAIRHTSDGTVVVAVADGVGDQSAQFAAVGAQAASVVSCDLISAHLEARRPIDPRDVSSQIASRMISVAAKRFISEPCDSKALATTLITAWVSPQGTAAGFMIGDGGVLDLTDGQVSVVAPARGTGTAFGEIHALPAAYTRVEEFSGRLRPGSALLLATDGLFDPLCSPDVAMVLGQAWKRPPAILDFVYDMSFERRGEADDRTGICIWFDTGHDGQ